MASDPPAKGQLNDAPVSRLWPAAAEAQLVRVFWIPEWSLPEGVTHRALVITYVTANLVVYPDEVRLHGPGTRIGHRDLSGTSWAVGARLAPAALPSLTGDVNGLVDSSVAVEAPGLSERMRAVMESREPSQRRHADASSLLGRWLKDTVTVEPDGLTANTLLDLLEGPNPPVRVADLAGHLHLSERSVHRLAERFFGLSPAAMIRRRRLQDAADEVRNHPETNLAHLAVATGYADQAHLTRDFRTVLGFTPSALRSGDHEGE